MVSELDIFSAIDVSLAINFIIPNGTRDYVKLIIHKLIATP
jgi:hypothetical protein